jgi:hypothetical protein
MSHPEEKVFAELQKMSQDVKLCGGIKILKKFKIYFRNKLSCHYLSLKPLEEIQINST